MAGGIQKNGPDIAPVGLKKYYMPRVPKNVTLRKLAKINKNNNQITRLTIDTNCLYQNGCRTYHSLCVMIQIAYIVKLVGI